MAGEHRLRASTLLAATALLVPALALGGGAASAKPRPEAHRIAAGRVIATRDCGGCHAVGPRGASPLQEAPRFRELGRRYPIEGLAEALAEGIVVGHGPMPERSYSSPDVEALVAYLQSLQKPVAPPARR